jgi:hypothetical protein
MSRRRRGSSNELVTIFWRDIPAQINASWDGERARALLSDRFQHAIDRAATVADKTETEAYVAEWRRQTTAIEGEPAGAADAERDRIETEYDPERLEALVWSGGVDESARPFAAAIGWRWRTPSRHPWGRDLRPR